MATTVVINGKDEFVIPKSDEMELRSWLEKHADIIVENTHVREIEDDDMIIDFQPTHGSREFEDTPGEAKNAEGTEK